MTLLQHLYHLYQTVDKAGWVHAFLLLLQILTLPTVCLSRIKYSDRAMFFQSSAMVKITEITYFSDFDGWYEHYPKLLYQLIVYPNDQLTKCILFLVAWLMILVSIDHFHIILFLLKYTTFISKDFELEYLVHRYNRIISN